MALIIENPYSNDPLPWLKGNLHTHTTNSDGLYSPQATLRKYKNLGYDFLMLSDHDAVTNPDELDDLGLILIPGSEITADGPHLLHVNSYERVAPDPDRAAVLKIIQSNGGFAIFSHPNWEENFDHCPQALLESLTGYAGIEIYNGVVRFLPGNPNATDRWDRLLAAGRRVWGYAHDDCHWEANYGIAWNMVQSAGHSRAEIVGALRTGRFYASTGVIIRSIRQDQQVITLETENAQRIAVIADYGRRVDQNDGRSLRFRVPEDCPYRYIRMECWGAGDAQAWTQPFGLRQA